MEEMRPDSEQFLKRIQYEEKREQEKTRGKMKVFLGYAAGTGKTYAMLEAAHEAEKSGIDVVAGYIEPHNRPDTEALREGLEEIPPLMVDYKGIQLREFDLDAALKRRPQLLLVDELAHTNVRGCRNEKRYQDVMELLQAGISVYSTVNIQHLESLNDLVAVSYTHLEAPGEGESFDVQIKIGEMVYQLQSDTGYFSRTDSQGTSYGKLAEDALLVVLTEAQVGHSLKEP